MSNNNFQKSKIIYERLYKEYGEWENLDRFADVFGISRQQINNRKKADTIDYDEIKRLFPEINRDWLYSDDEINLRTLPVKKKFTGKDKAMNVEEAVTLYESRKGDKEASDKEREILLEYLRGQAESLSKGLRRLADLDKNRSDE